MGSPGGLAGAQVSGQSPPTHTVNASGRQASPGRLERGQGPVFNDLASGSRDKEPDFNPRKDSNCGLPFF